MKILIIRNYPNYMELKKNTYNLQEVGLAKALVRKGNICDIVFWTDKEEYNVKIPVGNYGNVQVFYKHGKAFLKNAIYMGCAHLYEKYDILQPCEYNQIQSWILAKRYPQKVIIYHGPYFSVFNKRYNFMCKIFDVFFLKRYIKHNTRFLVKSNLAKEFLLNKKIKEGNVHSVGVGIDIEMLSGKKNTCTEEIYLQMKKDKDKLKILYVGRFEKRRNILFIFDVFKKLICLYTDAKLYLIGSGNNEYMKYVFNYAEQLGITDKIFWQESIEQKNLSSIYENADFFLLPTEYEIFGMVLLEAMYYRTVVLTSRNGGSGTLIDNEKNGFILDNNNPEKWASTINTIYTNKLYMKNIQDNAHNTISSKFTWDILSDKFLSEYEKITKLAED